MWWCGGFGGLGVVVVVGTVVVVVTVVGTVVVVVTVVPVVVVCVVVVCVVVVWVVPVVVVPPPLSLQPEMVRIGLCPSVPV